MIGIKPLAQENKCSMSRIVFYSMLIGGLLAAIAVLIGGCADTSAGHEVGLKNAGLVSSGVSGGIFTIFGINQMIKAGKHANKDPSTSSMEEKNFKRNNFNRGGYLFLIGLVMTMCIGLNFISGCGGFKMGLNLVMFGAFTIATVRAVWKSKCNKGAVEKYFFHYKKDNKTTNEEDNETTNEEDNKTTNKKDNKITPIETMAGNVQQAVTEAKNAAIDDQSDARSESGKSAVDIIEPEEPVFPEVMDFPTGKSDTNSVSGSAISKEEKEHEPVANGRPSLDLGEKQQTYPDLDESWDSILHSHKPGYKVKYNQDSSSSQPSLSRQISNRSLKRGHEEPDEPSFSAFTDYDSEYAEKDRYGDIFYLNHSVDTYVPDDKSTRSEEEEEEKIDSNPDSETAVIDAVDFDQHIKDLSMASNI